MSSIHLCSLFSNSTQFVLKIRSTSRACAYLFPETLRGWRTGRGRSLVRHTCTEAQSNKRTYRKGTRNPCCIKYKGTCCVSWAVNNTVCNGIPSDAGRQARFYFSPVLHEEMITCLANVSRRLWLSLVWLNCSQLATCLCLQSHPVREGRRQGKFNPFVLSKTIFFSQTCSVLLPTVRYRYPGRLFKASYSPVPWKDASDSVG